MRWEEYQEEAATFFRSIGFAAQVNAIVEGTRTSHAVDVLARTHQAGFDVTWIIECKHWNSPVSKLHVLGLRQIVADVGADRGVLLAEKGFQSGAHEAAELTNVHLSNLADLRRTASAALHALQLSELHDRMEADRTRYWAIPKEARIRHGLRQEFMDPGYSGGLSLDLIQEILRLAMRGAYPFQLDPLKALALPETPRSFGTPKEVVDFVNLHLSRLEALLAEAETSN